MRMFISIDVGSLPSLIDMEKKLGGTKADLRLVEPKNIHLTIKFLGNVDQLMIENIGKVMETAVEGIHPFKSNLRRMGVFPNQNYMKVIWIGMEGESIPKMASIIDEGLVKYGFKKEKRRFAPHITIARVKSGRKREELAELINLNKDRNFGTVEVDRIRLKKSELSPKGPSYLTLKEVILK